MLPKTDVDKVWGREVKVFLSYWSETKRLQTDRQIDMWKAICPYFFEGGHNKQSFRIGDLGKSFCTLGFLYMIVLCSKMIVYLLKYLFFFSLILVQGLLTMLLQLFTIPLNINQTFDNIHKTQYNVLPKYLHEVISKYRTALQLNIYSYKQYYK